MSPPVRRAARRRGRLTERFADAARPAAALAWHVTAVALLLTAGAFLALAVILLWLQWPVWVGFVSFSLVAGVLAVLGIIAAALKLNAVDGVPCDEPDECPECGPVCDGGVS